MLHELLHLDLAANSKNNNPNPQIRDLKIKYSEHKSDQKDIKHSWTKVYGPRLAKILARFQPIRTDQSLGYWIQRSDDSYTMFALASYVQQKFGYYPYIPLVYDQITDMPMLPLPRDGTGAGSLTNYDFVGYNASSAGDVVFVNITQGDKGECPTVYENGSDEDVEIGAAIPDSLYPSAYWDQYNKWIEEIKDLAGEPTSGTCKFNIEEIWTSEPADSNLYANIDLYDFSGTLIYSTPQSTSSPGVPIDDANPYHLMEEGMKEALIIVGEHANDYIQFTYGDQFWQSSDTEGTPSCTLIGNNWEQPTSDESSVSIKSSSVLPGFDSYLTLYRHETSNATTCAEFPDTEKHLPEWTISEANCLEISVHPQVFLNWCLYLMASTLAAPFRGRIAGY